MSYPPPPGIKSFSSAPQPPASLPARPPPSAVNPAPGFKPPSSGAPKSAFTAFAPRSVASANPYRANGPAHYSAAPVTTYSSTPHYAQQPQPEAAYQPQPQQYDAPSYGAPQIRNPFVASSGTASSTNPYGAPSNYDPEYEAQIQQWQSAYVNKEGDKPRPAATPTVPSRTDTPTQGVSQNQKESAPKTVQREGGGTKWSDSSLLEWDPAHFRIFVGNLAGEVTDESLLKAFAKYPSVQKAKVIRDKRTTKSKGYGFVSFSDGDEYFQAAREMQGKYIGSHPVLLKRSTTEVRPSTVQQNKGKGKGKGGGAGGHNKVDYGGVQKKQPKTKGGLKVLG